MYLFLMNGITYDFTQTLNKPIELFLFLFFTTNLRFECIKAILKSLVESIKEFTHTFLLFVTLDLIFVHGRKPWFTSITARLEHTIINRFGTNWQFNIFFIIEICLLLLYNSFSQLILLITLVILIIILIHIDSLILIKHHLMFVIHLIIILLFISILSIWLSNFNIIFLSAANHGVGLDLRLEVFALDWIARCVDHLSDWFIITLLMRKRWLINTFKDRHIIFI